MTTKTRVRVVASAAASVGIASLPCHRFHGEHRRALIDAADLPAADDEIARLIDQIVALGRSHWATTRRDDESEAGFTDPQELETAVAEKEFWLKARQAVSTPESPLRSRANLFGSEVRSVDVQNVGDGSETQAMADAPSVNAAGGAPEGRQPQRPLAVSDSIDGLGDESFFEHDVLAARVRPLGARPSQGGVVDPAIPVANTKGAGVGSVAGDGGSGGAAATGKGSGGSEIDDTLERSYVADEPRSGVDDQERSEPPEVGAIVSVATQDDSKDDGAELVVQSGQDDSKDDGAELVVQSGQDDSKDDGAELVVQSGDEVEEEELHDPGALFKAITQGSFEHLAPERRDEDEVDIELAEVTLPPGMLATPRWWKSKWAVLILVALVVLIVLAM